MMYRPVFSTAMSPPPPSAGRRWLRRPSAASLSRARNRSASARRRIWLAAPGKHDQWLAPGGRSYRAAPTSWPRIHWCSRRDCVYHLRMKLRALATLFIACTVGVTFASCATDDPATSGPAVQSSVQPSVVTCTPGAQTCDFGCGFDGSSWDNPTPSSDDCIIRCNAAGTGWELVEECGWAQNFPFSASCLNAQPQPICQNN